MASDPSLGDLADRLCEDLRSRWSSGDRVRVETYLNEHKQLTGSPAALLDLMYAEYLVREQSGDEPKPQEYYQRFPELREELSRLFDVHSAMKDEAEPAVASVPLTSPKTSYPEAIKPYASLLDTGIIDVERLTKLVSQFPLTARPKNLGDVTRLLEAKQLLTPFQAKRIAEGKAHTLRLGEYLLLGELGAGGMGQVFKARHLRMDRLVAIKMISPLAVKDQAAVKRFQREVRAAAKLEHPNIVAAHDAGEFNELHFLVMQYVEGRDLAQVVKQQGPLPVEQAVDYTLQAARGLSYAHGEGIIHRDIKPANLLLDKKGTVKVLDMGLARFEETSFADGLTASEQVMGTVDYMSPEQASSSHEADARSDIYSLGCTLWYLLTGGRLYDGDTIIKRIMQHAQAPLPSLMQRREEIPWALEQVCHRMVAKRPEDRFQSMSAVVTALEQLSGLPSVTAGSPPVVGGNQELSRFFKSFGEADRNQSDVRLAPATIAPAVAAHSDETTEALLAQVDTDPNSESVLPKESTPPPTPLSQAELHKPRNSNAKFIAAGLLGSLVLFAGIIITIKNREGQVVGSVEVPDGGSFTVDTGGGGTNAEKSTPVPTKRTPPPLAKAPFTPSQAKQHQEAWAHYLGLPVKRPSVGDGQLVLIPPGEFVMGAALEEIADEIAATKNGQGQDQTKASAIARFESEGPQHAVTIMRPFYVGETEVTVGEFRQFVEATKYVTTGERALAAGTNQYNKTWRNPGYEATDAFPAEYLSWLDAVAFCNWLSERESLSPAYQILGMLPIHGANGYRLPTEAEWEYACRAGTSTRYFWGNDAQRSNDFAVTRVVEPVRKRLPNPFGLYDVVGNVSEYCQDRYDANYYRTSPTIDPLGGAGDRMVIRGASILSPQLRSAYRNYYPPEGYGYHYGFRVVRPVAMPGTESTSPPRQQSTTSPYEILTSSDYEWTTPENLGPQINTSTGDLNPSLSADGLELIYLSYGKNSGALLQATRESVNESFGVPKSLGPEFENKLAAHGCTVSQDGLTLIFGSDRPGGLGKGDLWMAVRPSRREPFSTPVNLSALNSTEHEGKPVLTWDSLSVLFVSQRPGYANGSYWISRRPTTKAEFSNPVPFPLPLESSGKRYPSVYGLALSADQRVMIFAPSFGPSIPIDLCMSLRNTPLLEFGEAISFGPTINSDVTDDSPTLSADGTTLIFSSFRPGGMGNSDLWQSRRVPKRKATPASGADGALDRTVAEWVIAGGGSISFVNGTGNGITTVADLPAKPFQLKRVTLNNARFTPSDAQRLTLLPQLEGVTFASGEFLPQSLAELIASKSIRDMSFGSCMLKQHSLDELLLLKQLRKLDFSVCDVPDAFVARLGELPNLNRIKLYEANVSDVGLIALAKSPPPKLEQLGLTSTKVTAEGIKAIASLSHLSQLTLAKTKLDDRALVALESARSLSSIELDGTQVTREGIDRLQKAVGYCRVVNSPVGQNSTLNGPAYLAVIRKLLARGFIFELSTGSAIQSVSGNIPLPEGGIVTVRRADLPNTVTIDDLRDLAQLRDLEQWISQGRSFPEKALSELLPLQNLTSYAANGVPLLPDEAKQLLAFPKLRSVSAFFASDEAVSVIAALPHLSYLQVYGGGKLTDACLKSLEKVDTLNELRCFPPITRAAAVAFAAARPDVTVTWNLEVIPPPVLLPATSAPARAAQLPVESPFDALKRADIPLEELRAAGQGDPAKAPAELVAVFGDSRLKAWEFVRGLAYSPDGKTIASANSGNVELWDSVTGRQLWLSHSMTHGAPGSTLGVSLAFSPDGRTIATSCGYNNSASLWDTETGASKGVLRGHAEIVYGVAFSPDGLALATASADKTIRLWDVATLTEKSVLTGHTDKVNAVAFSPDGRTLASASDDKTVRLWDLTTGKERVTLIGHAEDINSVAFSPDGSTLASAGGDNNAASIKLWDVASAKEKEASLVGQKQFITSVAFSRDGHTLAAASIDGTVRLWDVATGFQRALLGALNDPAVMTVAFSPDGRTLATGGRDNSIRLWDVATGKETTPSSGHGAALTSLALSPDNRTLATGSLDHSVRLWDTGTGRESLKLTGHNQKVLSVAFAPNGHMIASGGADGSVKLWNPTNGRETESIPNYYGAAFATVFSPDGTLLAVGAGKSAVFWDLTTKKITNATPSVEGGQITTVAFSPDGRTIAVGGAGTLNKVVTLWEVATGKLQATLAGHGDSIYQVAFSPDGKTLASVGVGNTARLWDVATGKEKHALIAPTSYNTHGAAFSPDGRILATCVQDGTVRLWDVASGAGLKTWTLGSVPSCIEDLCFDATGRYLLTANGNGTTYVLRLADPPEAQPVVQGDPDRRAAEWVLSIGGKVDVVVGSNELRGIADSGKLPTVPFQVASVYLTSNTQFSDADLERLNTLKIQRLVLTNSSVTDVGLRQLKDVPRLSIVALEGTGITDNGASHLATFKRMGALNIDSTRITDLGLAKLKPLQFLTTVNATDTEITAAGVADFHRSSPYSRIRWGKLNGILEEPAVDFDRPAAEWVLSIGGSVCINFKPDIVSKPEQLPKEKFALTSITLDGSTTKPRALDPGLNKIQYLLGLGSLSMSYTDASDPMLLKLRHLPTLRALNLKGTQAGDVAMEHFATFESLRYIMLENTNVTDAGLQRLCSLTEVSQLHLSGAHAGGKLLAEFPNLKQVQIDSKQAKDLNGDETITVMFLVDADEASIEHLCRIKLKGLTDVRFAGKRPTYALIMAILEAYPKCLIDGKPGIPLPAASGTK